MSTDHNATRVRSGLSAPLQPGWWASDAIELRGPEGMALSVASYPVDGSAGLAALAASDRVPGAEPVGGPRPVQLLGSDPGLVQRFDSGGNFGFSQLAGYSLRGDRLIVVRATCGRDQFDARRAEMQSLMESAAIDPVAAPRLPRPRKQEVFSSALAAFLAGVSVCELPERPAAQGQATLTAGWTTQQGAPAAPLGPVPMLTEPELHAVAQLHGQSAFPGIRRPAAGTEADIGSFGRSVLMARGLVQFASPDTIDVDRTITDVAAQAFHAEMVVDAVLSGRRQRRATYFVGASSTLSVVSYPGRVHACRTIATGEAFADLLAIVGELADDVDRSPSSDEPDLAAPDRDEIVVHAISVDGGRVEIDSIRLVSQPDVGCFVEEPPGKWIRLAPGAAAPRLLETLTC